MGHTESASQIHCFQQTLPAILAVYRVYINMIRWCKQFDRHGEALCLSFAMISLLKWYSNPEEMLEMVSPSNLLTYYVL